MQFRDIIPFIILREVNMFKKFLTLLIVIGLATSLTACGIKGNLDLPNDDDGEIYIK